MDISQMFKSQESGETYWQNGFGRAGYNIGMVR